MKPENRAEQAQATHHAKAGVHPPAIGSRRLVLDARSSFVRHDGLILPKTKLHNARAHIIHARFRGSVTVARVILADDHPLFMEALAEAIGRAGIEVVGKATSGDDLIALARTTDADAVLLDLAMPGRDGFECLKLLREQRPELALIVVSGSSEEADIRRALDLGAVCFVGKATDPTDLAGAVHILLLGSVHLPRSQPDGAARNGDGHERVPEALLTPRELEILRLAAQGQSNAQIATALWVTEQTVKFHLANTYRKINVSNRTSAARWAENHGLL